ncbi:MAG: hypothetical protein EHM87_13230 [Burkholderiales bacterium]|nr:MAG: hypothetical protein EHM87_13230 [Burkholderiales bacterium]
MRTALWIVAGLLLAIWTGGALLTVELVEWAGRLLASGQATDLAAAAARWPVPAWAVLWVDPALLEPMRQAVIWTLGVFGGLLPALGSASGWLGIAVWLLWGLGAAVLLALAGVGHLLLGRLRTGSPQTA